MLKQPCYFYNTTGKCRFGKHCRFGHELGTEIKPEIHPSENQDEISVNKQPSSLPEPSSISSVSSHKENQNEGIKKKAEQRVLQGDICKFYAAGKFCRFGRRCRFEHVRQQEQKHNDEKVCDDLKAPKNAEPEKVQDEGKTGGEPEKSEAEGGQDAKKLLSNKKEGKGSKNKKKECKFFKEGNCRFGNKCRFVHPSSEATLVEGVKKLELSKEKKLNTADTPAVASSTTKANASNVQTRKPVRPPQVVKVLKRDEVSQEKLTELYKTEITQLKRRFPTDRLKVVGEEDGKEAFIFTFTPTDPDWPFDVKSFDIQVAFDKEYPLKVFSLSLPEEQDLPETVRWSVEKSLREWADKQQRDGERQGTVELLFRPFLRWLDRNIEDIVTEGLKQLRRELQAQAAGIQFVSARELKKDYAGDQEGPTATEGSDSEGAESGDSVEDNPDVRVYRKTKEAPEEVYQVPERESSSDDDDDSDEDTDSDNDSGETGKDTRVHQRPQINPDTERRGTEMMFRNMQIWYVTTLLLEKLHLSVQCDRCRTTSDFTTPPGRANALECGKCNNTMLVAFRATLTHSYSSTFGYLDVEGCSAFDVILQDCHFSLGCIMCHRDMLVKKMNPGRVTEVWCRGCHKQMKFSADSVKLRVLDTSAGVDTTQYSGNVHKVPTKKLTRTVRDPAIQEGKPLPDQGSCKHYKKSYRWLRFPCCGKAYACDLCHDDKESDHDMVRANRMICGFCCREQPYSAERPCVGCRSALTKVKTTHWEGGHGCRDKIAMGRNDEKKYANLNKTISNKAQELNEKKKNRKNRTKTTIAKKAEKTFFSW